MVHYVTCGINHLIAKTSKGIFHYNLFKQNTTEDTKFLLVNTKLVQKRPSPAVAVNNIVDNNAR